jgi:hypothetical protein
MKLKLTPQSVAALQLPPDKNEDWVWDTDTEGFGIRLRRPDKKTFYAQIKVLGRTQKLAIGSAGRIDLEPARAAARRFFAEAVLGHDPLKTRQEARAAAALTFEAVAKRYLTARSDVLRSGSLNQAKRYLTGTYFVAPSAPARSALRHGQLPRWSYASVWHRPVM